MALEMKPECQWRVAPLGWQGEALICSYERSWCRPGVEGNGVVHGGRQSRHEYHRPDRRDELAIHLHLL